MRSTAAATPLAISSKSLDLTIVSFSVALSVLALILFSLLMMDFVSHVSESIESTDEERDVLN